MTKQLYEEALADVKKLKEVAEDNAKRALLEAVTPRIKDLIESQLLGELPVEDEDDLLLDDEIESSELPVSAGSENLPDAAGPAPEIPQDQIAPINPSPMFDAVDASAEAISTPDEEGKVTLDLDALKVPETEEFELSVESATSLGLLMTNDKRTADFESKLTSLNSQVKNAASASRIVRESREFSSTLSTIISAVKDTYSYLQKNMHDSPKKGVYESILEKQFATLNELMEQKMKRNRTLSESDVTLKLTGMPEDIDLDSVGVDLVTGGEDEGGDEEDSDLDLDVSDEDGDEEGGDLDLDVSDEGGDEDEGSKMESRSRMNDRTVVEIDEGMLRREIARMKALREEKIPSIKGNGHGKVADGWEDDDLGDPFVDGEVTTESMEEVDDGILEIDMSEAEDEPESGGNVDEPSDKQSRQPGGTVESIKRRIAAEAKLQSEAKKKAVKAKNAQKEAQKRGAKSKKMQEKQACKKQAKKMQEAYVYYAKKFNESVARTNKLTSMLSETARSGRAQNSTPTRSAGATDNLREKLAETNLFNAKLLFTNKLLQNESLTKRQKAEVIERLDEAKTEREAKLVYESVVKTIQGSTSQRLTETIERSVGGSSSRPMRSSGVTLNEGFQSDRWAKLAGIVK